MRMDGLRAADACGGFLVYPRRHLSSRRARRLFRNRPCGGRRRGGVGQRDRACQEAGALAPYTFLQVIFARTALGPSFGSSKICFCICSLSQYNKSPLIYPQNVGSSPPKCGKFFGRLNKKLNTYNDLRDLQKCRIYRSIEGRVRDPFPSVDLPAAGAWIPLESRLGILSECQEDSKAGILPIGSTGICRPTAASAVGLGGGIKSRAGVGAAAAESQRRSQRR